MKRLVLTALLTSGALAHAQTTAPAASAAATATATSPAKKELVQKILSLQQGGIEGMARNLVEQPAMRLLQAAAQTLQQVPKEKREAAAKTIEADIRKYVEDTTPVIRDRAVKLAPSTLGATLEEKFTEDELKQLVAMLDSPVNRKYAQLGPEMQSAFSQKLVADTRSLVEPRLLTLEGKVRTTLGVSAPAAKASAPKPAASK